MKNFPALSIKLIVLISVSQLVSSCFSYKPLVKNQSSKSMDEIIKKVSINKLHMVKLKTGVSVKIKIKRVDEENMYGTLYQKDARGAVHLYENDTIDISIINDIKVRKVAIGAIVIPIAIVGVGALLVLPSFLIVEYY